ncbi:MAG: class I mannose-6-phosphate isomerase [Chloroflexi bacterium]|nr:class I mannose-6-phosphate isomerase [Chloroflexota bacterium]
MEKRIYPLTFISQFRDYIWGGRHLETILGREIPPGIVAESWEISAHPYAPTTVAEGPLAGRTLSELVEEMGEVLVGSRSRRMLELGRFPLLIKLLDANRDLSVQVHPDDEYARAHGDDALGKTELWIVLHAEPGTELICGLAEPTTRERFRQALERGRLEALLHRIPIAPDDAIFLPAGTIHALLAGALVAEIQQNSDATYRVYDWGRLGADGKPRPLHIDKALDVIDWSRIRPDKVSPSTLCRRADLLHQRLVHTDAFTVERLNMTAGAIYKGCCRGETFEIWGCLRGAAEIAWAGDPVALPAVRFALLPAILGEFTVHALGDSALLRVYV